LFLPAFPVRESRHDSGSLSVFAAFSSSHFGFYHPRGSRSPRALLARIKASFPFPVDPSAAECLGPLEHHVLLPEKHDSATSAAAKVSFSPVVRSKLVPWSGAAKSRSLVC
jgi:hypothetical protein